ncbi:MAG TPA: 50S ribosomal protein L11 methyltransferase [Candidatus Limnocylindrales bacterium]|nr:50S ribosomal protein L11 methyltransferase [Candidatus Limnocylindrales bacterium]
MEWIEISIMTSQEAQELISNFLMDLGSPGVVLEDNSPLPPFPESEIDSRKEVKDCLIKGYFPLKVDLTKVTDQVGKYLALLESNQISVGAKTLQTRILREEDWESNWKKYFKPFPVGKRLVIKPSWESCETKPDQVVIDIDPGMAFGTGKHETTQLCLELLEESISPGIRVLDIGTGSGILAIAAAKLGASRVLGVEIDPVTIQYARENLIKNAVQSKITLYLGSLESLGQVDEPFDLVLMNIRPRVILSLVEPLKKYLKPASLLILSGILQTEEQEFIEALKEKSLIIKEQKLKGEWIALVCMQTFAC